MRRWLALLALLASSAHAQVNWLDSLAYVKPRPYPIAMPSEASAPKYYVNLSSGSGSTCIQAAPCATLNAVAGKSGTAGGPAVIYVKGNGYLNLTSGNLFGSAGNEIVIRPWPNDSTPTVWTAQSGCTRTNANYIHAAGVHNLIFDGGPDMLIRFRGSGCTNDENGYTLVVSSDDITLYRVRVDANSSRGPALGPAVGGGSQTDRFRFINSELYGASRYYGVYGGGGTGCAAGDTSFTDMEFRNSIFRNIDGRGIQVEPRANSTGLIVAGNVFYDIGYDRSGNMGNAPSSAVQPAGACDGSNDGWTVSSIQIYNNVAWDLGGGFVRVDFSGRLTGAGSNSAAGFRIFGNTILDYAKSARTPNKNSHGIGVEADGMLAEARNNIFLQNNKTVQGVCAFDCGRSSGILSGFNLCDASGNGCGSSSVSGTVANTLESTSTSSLLYLRPKPAGPAVNAGTNTSSSIPESARDFTGKKRPQGSGYDIGAIESGTGSTSTRPNPPTAN